jgi:hypothetical protein
MNNECKGSFSAQSLRGKRHKPITVSIKSQKNRDGKRQPVARYVQMSKERTKTFRRPLTERLADRTLYYTHGRQSSQLLSGVDGL